MMRRAGFVGLLLLPLGCASHPEEGTVVKPAPGVPGVPGGSLGVRAERAAPVAGGTLAISDQSVAVASDPDRDRIFVVDLQRGAVSSVVTEPRAEPGRVVMDDSGRAHVVLRRAGSVVSIDLATAEVVGTRAVCPAPRGIAFDASTDALHIACDTGELVSLPASGGGVTNSVFIERGLRDVVVQGDGLLVTTFKTAEVLSIDSSAEVTARRSLGTSASVISGGFEPDVAWRAVAVDDGRVAIAHQRANPGQISVGPSGYYSTAAPCAAGIVHGTVSVVDSSGGAPTANPALPHMVGPSDIAVSPDGNQLAIVSLGNAWAAPEQDQPTVVVMPLTSLGAGLDSCATEGETVSAGEPVAVAYTPSGQVVVQSREPATLEVLGGSVIELSKESRADTGVALFHMNSGFGVACASCHPEGGEDGRVWNFTESGPRRTQSFAGGLGSTAPFHWSGDVEDMSTLVHEVFVSRMGGPRPNRAQVALFTNWLDRIPAPVRPKLDTAQVARGEAIFEDPAVGCADCHSGDLLTNNRTVDVGTGGFFQVPSLIGLDARAPFMHDGCASDLEARFGSCGGTLHGQTAELDETERADLITYLRSL